MRWDELPEHQRPPCVGERASFMAPFPMSRIRQHEYAKMGKSSHQHFAPTRIAQPAYSAEAVPFRWLHRDYAQHHAARLDLPMRMELEEEADRVIGFKGVWIQHRHNQLMLLDSFFSAVVPKQSLCFFYTKQLPFVEEPGRFLLGAGWVTDVGPALEWQYTRQGPWRAMMWERVVSHSIRPDGADGVLVPYHQATRHAAEDPRFDPAELAVRVDGEHCDQFSYVSEHVTHDAAIAALLALETGLKRAEQALEGRWDTERQWINDRLGELWTLRGPYPGLGAALEAFGVRHGTLLAYELAKRLVPGDDPWPLVD